VAQDYPTAEAYRIITAAQTARQEFDVTIIGPGIEPAGRRFVFVSRERAERYLTLLNFAYAQGISEGLALARVHPAKKSTSV
jgi:hypothetical protein